MRRHFFTQRVVSLWNSLPQEVADAKTLNVFKRRLDIALGGEWDQKVMGRKQDEAIELDDQP